MSPRPRDRSEVLGEGLRFSTTATLASLARQVQRSVETELPGTGFGWPGFAILSLLVSGPPLAQHVIVDRTGVDRTTVSRSLERMEDWGLVTRERGLIDSRTLVAFPTFRAKEWVEEVAPLVERGERRALRRLTTHERRRLNELVGRALPPPRFGSLLPGSMNRI